MMMRINVELPEHASRKLSDLEFLRASAEDQMRACQSRINSVAPDNTGLRERLAAERDRQSQRHNQLHQLLAKLNQYLMQLRLPPGSVLEPAPVLDLKLKSESLVEAVGTIRREGFEITQQIAKVRSAPLKKSSQLEAMRAYLARLQQRMAPRISFDQRGNAKVSWAEDMVAGKDDVLGMLCWLTGPQPVLAAFERDIEAEAPNAVTPLEREQQIGKLTNNLLALERKEEYLIERAAASGIEILRRPDASPLAVLNLVISQAQQQVA
jgi:hypothetical protein